MNKFKWNWQWRSFFIYKLHLEYSAKLFDFGLQCRDLINQWPFRTDRCFPQTRTKDIRFHFIWNPEVMISAYIFTAGSPDKSVWVFKLPEHRDKMRHPQIVSHIFLPTHLAAARLGSVGWLLGSSSSPRTRWRRGASHKHTHTHNISVHREQACSVMRCVNFVHQHPPFSWARRCPGSIAVCMTGRPSCRWFLAWQRETVKPLQWR